MIKNFNKSLRYKLPAKWNNREVLRYITRTKFKIDLNALNKNLNSPSREYMLRGGKRIRPVLFLKLIDAFGMRAKKYLDYALFIETIHNGTLVIDDVEDDTILRRGGPACHTLYGLDTAINAGTAMYFMPLNILINDKHKLSASKKNRLWEIYGQELINVHFGQSIDIYWHKAIPSIVSTSEYLEMCRLKTGSLMRMPAKMACVISGRNKETEKICESFAEQAGIAFQIIDDVLDLTADRKKFGKAYGNDITEAKLSLPMLIAFEELSKREQTSLRSILKKHTRNSKLISKAIKLIRKTGAIEGSLSVADKLLKRAVLDIQKLGVKKEKKEDLIAFIKSFIIRDR